jgi:sulfite exporter TauE/SafE
MKQPFKLSTREQTSQFPSHFTLNHQPTTTFSNTLGRVQNHIVIWAAMEKLGKVAEPETRKPASTFVMKLLLFALSVIVMIQFAVVVKNFASLNALNKRLDAIDEEKALSSKSLLSENEYPSRRAKRSTHHETDVKKALAKLENLKR